MIELAIAPDYIERVRAQAEAGQSIKSETALLLLRLLDVRSEMLAGKECQVVDLLETNGTLRVMLGLSRVPTEAR